MNVHGPCHCGSMRYEAVVDPDKVSLCHCTDCKMLSGSPYRVSVPAPRETFRLSGGAPRIYVKTAESGARRAHAFCPDCGSPIYSSAVTDPTSYTLRVGCLEERAALPPKRQIWCRSALDWSTDLRGIAQTIRQ